MNKDDFRKKLRVSSPTSLAIGYTEWHCLDTKLVGKVGAIIEENKQLKEDYAKLISDNCYTLQLEQENAKLKQELEELKQDIEDNYKRIDVSEQIGISERDFY